MTKKKSPSIAIDQATYAAMQDYATSSGLPLPELLKRMWQLWMTVDQAHETLFPHQLAGDHQGDASLEQFLDEMEHEADRLSNPSRRKLPDERKELVEWLNNTDIEQY